MPGQTPDTPTTSRLGQAKGESPERQKEETRSATGVTHDAEYYLPDGAVIFLVEDKLFRIHQFFLARDSEFFRGLFACPPPPGEEVEGKTDENAIRLEGVTVKEFRCLLRFFYDNMYSRTIKTLEDWIALLSISTRFVFDKIRDMAITELSSTMLDPIKKITLATKYNIPQWLSSAYVDLCKRPEPLNDEEAETLGLRNVVRVARAREAVRDKGHVTSSIRSYFPHDKIYAFNERGVLSIVNDVWPESVVADSPVS